MLASRRRRDSESLEPGDSTYRVERAAVVPAYPRRTGNESPENIRRSGRHIRVVSSCIIVDASLLKRDGRERLRLKFRNVQSNGMVMADATGEPARCIFSVC